jgi:single-strand DNA-binding protein
MVRIEIIGNVCADAQVKDLNNNQLISFSVAVNESFTQNGEKQTKTTFFDCTKWGNNTAVAQFIKKGDLIFVSGKPNNRAYTKEDGSIQVVNGITVFEIELLGSNKQE